MDNVFSKATRQILKSLVRILYRKGVAFGEFNQQAKQVYVETAEEALQLAGERPTTSRIAIATGLTRKEVAKLRQQDEAGSEDASSSYNRGIRVMSGWLKDEEFQDGNGRPARIPVQGEYGSFFVLVNRYSGDMPYRAVLSEMSRLGVIKEWEDGYVELLGGGYIPHDDENEKLSILGTDVSELIATIDHNLVANSREDLFFQRKVSYDNLPNDVLPAFKKMVEKDGMALLIQFNEWLAEKDRDSNPQSKGSGQMRAGVGIYYFEEPGVAPEQPKELTDDV